MRAMLLGCLLMVILTGCMARGGPTAPAELQVAAVPPVELPPPAHIPFYLPQGVGHDGTFIDNGQPRGGDLDVAENVSALVVSANWTCLSPTCSLMIGAVLLSNGPGTAATGEHAVSFIVKDPAAGRWNVAARADSLVVEARGTIDVTQLPPTPR